MRDISFLVNFSEKTVLPVTILLRKVARCILGTRDRVLTFLRRQREKNIFKTGCGRLVFFIMQSQSLQIRLETAKIVTLEIETPKVENPWLKIAGKYKDDSQFDEMLEYIKEYRRELDERRELR